MRGSGDLNGRTDPLPPDAELLEIAGGVGGLGAVRIRSRSGERLGSAIMVPGYTGSREDFTCLLEPLAERGFDVLAYSQRGQLGSYGPGGTGPCSDGDNYRLEDFVADLLLVVDSVPNRPHLLGHSFGGLVGLAAVLKRPGAFASYTHWNSGPRSRGVNQERMRAIEEEGSLGLWKLMNPVPGLLGDEEDWLKQRTISTTSGNLWGGARILQDQLDQVDELGATGVPVLVSHGEFDEFWDHDWQREMAERLGADYRVIPGGSHCAQFEAPDLSAEALADFWSANPDRTRTAEEGESG
ncbi:MAG: alpha/beta hydrolase [Cryobacterium sp.]|nr:alpha/beta hydrolase [Cryobacterium sp.]